MATIRPSTMVKPNTTRGRPPGAHTAPAAPSTRAGRARTARPEKLPATAAPPGCPPPRPPPHPGGPVAQGGAGPDGPPREVAGHGRRPADLLVRAGPHRRLVGPEDHGGGGKGR